VRSLFFVKRGISHIDVTFDKDSYYTNERAQLNCQIDNSHCDKNIKEIKVKLRREIEASNTSDSKKYNDTTYLMINTFSGVSNSKNELRRLELALNGFIDVERRIKRVHKKKKMDLLLEDIALQSQMLPSTCTQLFQVKYFLEVHVYHKGLTFKKEQIPPAVFEIKIHPANA
jgi:hypothetical protein